MSELKIYILGKLYNSLSAQEQHRKFSIKLRFVIGRSVRAGIFAFLIGNCWVILLHYFFSSIYIVRLLSEFQKFLSESIKMYQECKNKLSTRVLHFLANFDFKLAWAIFRVEIRQLSLL